MPLDILPVAVSQRGTSRRHRTLTTLAAVCDTDGELVRQCATSSRPMLTKVDPYGDLVLTSSEMEQLADELRSLDVEARGPARPIVEALLGLAAQCAADPTTELHFVGD